MVTLHLSWTMLYYYKFESNDKSSAFEKKNYEQNLFNIAQSTICKTNSYL